MAESGERLSVVAFWTREIHGTEVFGGRINVARAIHEAVLTPIGTIHFGLKTVFEPLRPLGVFRCLSAWVFSLARPLPFQCAIFAGGVNAIMNSLPHTVDCAYFDGIRTLLLIRKFRRKYPNARIVVDLDDLMSRRMQLWLDAGAAPSLGYLEQKIPRFLAAMVSGPLARFVTVYESRALQRAEREILELSDTVILHSSVDRADLIALAQDQAAAERVTIIPPPVLVTRPPKPLRHPYRFVFIGSDKLNQNRLAIDYLISLWRKYEPKVELHLFGQNKLVYENLPPRVVLRGYVEDLASVYDGHSVLLSIARMGGGVKTKVIEAFGYGTAVVGNSLTFEGLQLPEYPLCFDQESDLRDVLTRTENYLELFSASAEIGHSFVRDQLNLSKFTATWRSALLGARSPDQRARLTGQVPEPPRSRDLVTLRTDVRLGA